ncbi:hypothetical protein HMPREF1040_1519 [Megasphaera sp. UPII 135-E]|nr:hypothetical protein HMPREF1040_1519 [Megasphaera sp. UPII 135-E]
MVLKGGKNNIKFSEAVDMATLKKMPQIDLSGGIYQMYSL